MIERTLNGDHLRRLVQGEDVELDGVRINLRPLLPLWHVECGFGYSIDIRASSAISAATKFKKRIRSLSNLIFVGKENADLGESEVYLRECL